MIILHASNILKLPLDLLNASLIMVFYSYIPPYIIFASWLRRTPDIQAETGQPIYFWNPLLKAVVLQKPDFLVLPFMKPERSQ